jgi:hypothetical protein
MDGAVKQRWAFAGLPCSTREGRSWGRGSGPAGVHVHEDVREPLSDQPSRFSHRWALAKTAMARYLPVIARRVRAALPSECGTVKDELLCEDRCERRRPAAASLDEFSGVATFELELSTGLPRNGVVVVECRVRGGGLQELHCWAG